MAEEELFHVLIYNCDGFWHYVRQNLTAERAVDRAHRLVRMAEADNEPDIDRVMIIDSGDFTNFLWERGKGIVFPTRGNVQ